MGYGGQPVRLISRSCVSRLRVVGSIYILGQERERSRMYLWVSTLLYRNAKDINVIKHTGVQPRGHVPPKVPTPHISANYPYGITKLEQRG